jgi:hypothetical protein
VELFTIHERVDPKPSGVEELLALAAVLEAGDRERQRANSRRAIAGGVVNAATRSTTTVLRLRACGIGTGENTVVHLGEKRIDHC